MSGQTRKVPIRTCVSCRETSEKKRLIRIVRTGTGDVVIDPSGKMPGRGAYLCSANKCIQLAIKANKLGRALRCEIPECLNEELKKLVENEQ
ncbi:MAG: YlxR family protein [Armatimonadota bacterium]